MNWGFKKRFEFIDELIIQREHFKLGSAQVYGSKLP